VIWLTWRQHRLQLACAAGLLVVLGAAAALTGARMSDFFATSGLDACLTTGGDCQGLSLQFRERFSGLLNGLGYLNLLPLLIGFFWGAPLLAREVEHGTHRLVWTQTTGRGRWLAVKLTALVAATVLAALAASQLMSWWLTPFERLDTLSRMSPDTFELRGALPIAYTLFALALGAAAGALVRRTLPAMAITLAGFVAVRWTIATRRDDLVDPLRITYPAGTQSPRADLGDWILYDRSGFIDAHGQRVSFGRIDQFCPPDKATVKMPIDCLRDHGLQRMDLYHPDSHFWALQTTESAIFLTLAAVLLAVTVTWTLRRLS
jgi:hypothetical protein